MSRARSFHSQYWRVARSGGNDSLIFFQVGRFIEFYGPQRFLAVQALGLRVVAMDRGRFALTARFPTGLCEIYLPRAIRQGVVVVVVREEPARHSHAGAARLPSSLLIPVGRKTNFNRPFDFAPPVGSVRRRNRVTDYCCGTGVGNSCANILTHSRCSAVSGTAHPRAALKRWKAVSGSTPVMISKQAANSADRPIPCRQ